MGRRGRGRPPRSRGDCNLHKLSLRFDDGVAGASAVKKREGNDRRIELFAFRTLDRRDTASRALNARTRAILHYLHRPLDYFRNVSEIEMKYGR